MLARVARDFGFKIGTYQHILEGYKVADEIEKHAIGASAFSDWWAFKVEVQDAIPQGGPIMSEVGVNVSYNSDSDEMARRMNTEAAKAVKYGDPAKMSKAEALKYVTINPAVQLGIEGLVGSLEVGKDGDFVVWSGEPLSGLSRCEMTYIEGRRVFSLEDDAALRAQNVEHRTRIVQRLLADVRERPTRGGRGGGGGSRESGEGREGMVDVPGGRKPTREDEDEDEVWARERQEVFMDMLRRGVVPEDARAGECGCGWH
jgi:N-acetylglucosamine-6-phosphate deacetylase